MEIGFVLIIVFFIIILLIFLSPKDLNYLIYNPFIRLTILAIIIYISFKNNLIGLLLLILFLLFYFRKYIETFDVVEDDDVDKIVKYTDDSFLSELYNDEDAVTGVWGCSTLGKTMGLCKA